ncbi:MAG: histidine phosphatase family protein [Candidatus Binatia bacterium]
MRPEDGAAGATLLLMRHGETAWNREKRIMGDLDIALSGQGRGQCTEAAALLAGFGIDRIVTSPLRRAAETADIVASSLGVPVTSDPRLVEVRFGDWQGKTYEEVAADPRYLAFASDPVAMPTPGGETVATVQGRGLAALSAVRGGECVLFVTHGDIIRTLLCHFLATPLGQYRRIRTDNCGLSAIAVGSGMPEVKFLNVLADQQRARSLTHWSGRP